MIFITGCNGLIGSFVARKLLSQNYRIRALKRTSSDLSLIKDISHQIEWVNGDITDITMLEKSLEGINTVIHSAAIVSFTPSDAEMMLKVNVEGTSNIVNASLKNNISRFCHISSIAALGRKKGSALINENSSWENSSYNTNYAQSKYLAELEVWRGTEEGLNAFIINPSVVLGPGDWNAGSSRIFKYVWDEGYFYSRGQANFVDVRDVSEILCRLINSKNMSGERYILNGAKMHYKDLFYKIADGFSKKRPPYKANALLSDIAWRMEVAKSVFTGKKPLITKETVRLSRHTFNYDNTKIKKLLNYEFTDPDKTIKWVCEELVKKYCM
jgi:dihydroflavonol-4-reductase